MANEKAFRVEMETMPCRCYTKGGYWIVVGPNEVATSVSYGDKEEADHQARDMNYAFDLGVKFGKKKAE